MFTFLSVLLLIIAVALAALKFVSRPASSQLNSYGRPVNPGFLPFMSKMSWKALLVPIGLAIPLMFATKLFMWSEPGYQYFLVYPNGTKDAVMTEGINWRGFAQITPWQKYIDVKVPSENDNLDEIEGIMKPIPIRFIDQVTANVYASTRFQLPRDKETFIELAIKFRSMENLVQNTLIPTVREQVNNTGYMFAAQDYISGEAQSFRQTLDEQLKDGAYAVEKTTTRDTLFSTSIQSKERKIKEIQTKYSVEKILVEGKPKRIEHEITENKIIVSQVIVDAVELEKTFKVRLEKQRDESALRQLEQQKIETAKSSQERIIAEGERDKAEERVNQEKEQVKALISIETKLKQESTNRDLAKIQLETERLLADQVKVRADAEAYEISKKVKAGITPETELKMKLDRDVKVASELAKIKFPQTMIIGGEGGNSGTPLETLVGAAMAKQLTSTSKN